MKESILRRFIKLVFKMGLFLFILSIVPVVSLKWINPPTSSFMLQDQFSSTSKNKKKRQRYSWVDYNRISANIKLAVIASEDQHFPYHFGLDFNAIEKAYADNRAGKRIRGASTITQQVAKNLFLWKGRSYFRKALEAYYSLLIEVVWDKKRILEVYLNIAEMGPSIYGVKEASRYYFRRPPASLTKKQSVYLAAILPNPNYYSVRRPSRYVRRKRQWILRQMVSIGGLNFLKNL